MLILSILLIICILFLANSLNREISGKKKLQDELNGLRASILSIEQKNNYELAKKDFKYIQELDKSKIQYLNEFRDELEKWKEIEISRIREQAEKEEFLKGQEWKKKEEVNLREDAIKKSKSVIHGQISEQFLPFMPQFSWNPKDARFLGSPIDLILFDGLDKGKLERIIFIEVKTGVSSLSGRERQIRDCVSEKRIEYQLIKLEKGE